MKLASFAGTVGIVAGVMAILGDLLPRALTYPTSNNCSIYLCGQSYIPVVIAALGAVLVVDSIASIVGPNQALYGEAVVSVLAGLVLLAVLGDTYGVYFWSVLLLSFLGAGVSLIAARRRTSLSEQSHPMNLPVFG